MDKNVVEILQVVVIHVMLHETNQTTSFHGDRSNNEGARNNQRRFIKEKQESCMENIQQDYCMCILYVLMVLTPAETADANLRIDAMTCVFL